MTENINKINSDFYNSFGDSFTSIPFETILPELILKYTTGHTLLEIGSGPGTLAAWLTSKGYEVTCIEPAQKLAELAIKKGLSVFPLTIQEFETDTRYDCAIAISSLIHVPKIELPSQIKKIAKLLKPQGVLFTSFIEGENEGLEDPTTTGKMRYFSKWRESELRDLLAPYFEVLESHKIYSKKMDRTFLLSVYALKN